MNLPKIGRKKLKELNCKQCDGVMKQKRVAASSGLGCFLLIIAFFLIWFFPIGTILAFILVVAGLVYGSRANKFWVCQKCGSRIERQ